MAMGKEIGMDQSDPRAHAEIPMDELIESTLPSSVDKSAPQQHAGGQGANGRLTHTDGMAVPIDELIKKTKPG